MADSGNLLISGATMLLPNATKVGDLRIKNGIIAEIGELGALEGMDDELFVDGLDYICFLVLLTHKSTFETPANQKEKTWGAVQQLQLVAELLHFLTCQIMFPLLRR